jgi:hypothetical protein
MAAATAIKAANSANGSARIASNTHFATFMIVL